jgi:hypothetical protein
MEGIPRSDRRPGEQLKRTVVHRLAAAAVAFGLLGAVGLYLFWDPAPSYESVVDEGAFAADRGDLEAVAERRIFFGHMSVGKNIIAGLNEVYAAHGVTPPTQLEISPGDGPTMPSDGVLVHALIGENRHPVGKLVNFDATLRGGLADQVDTAALKFCYIDIRWNSDVDTLFARYQETLSRLEADYPQVQFVHMTVPLTTGPYGIRDHLKILAGRNDNAARERYNDLMRQAYGSERLFDLAALEATEPDGRMREKVLFGGYSSDGAHLNEAGSARVAAEFVEFLANSPRRS